MHLRAQLDREASLTVGTCTTRSGEHRLLALQRSAGNRAVAQLVQRQLREREDPYRAFDPLAPRPPSIVPFALPDPALPAGTVVRRRFGRFVIVTPGQTLPPRTRGEPVTAPLLRHLDYLWSMLEHGTGSIVIEPNGHRGFRDMILNALAMLMSRPAGRRLISNILSQPFRVTIVAEPTDGGEQQVSALEPSRAAVRPERDAVGLTGRFLRGPGTSSRVRIDPGLQDDSYYVEDEHHRAVEEPVFIALGHELIHAYRAARGRQRSVLPPSEAGDPHHFDTAEEEDTITLPAEYGDVTENDLRREHGLPARASHRGGLRPLGRDGQPVPLHLIRLPGAAPVRRRSSPTASR